MTTTPTLEPSSAPSRPLPTMNDDPVLRILTVDAQTALLRLRAYCLDEASTLSADDNARLCQLGALATDLELAPTP